MGRLSNTSIKEIIDYIYDHESVATGLLTEELIHIVTTAYMNGLFEVVRRRMNRGTAHRYINMIRQHHRSEFETIIRQ